MMLKDNITIVLTDSGLGGISVCAGIELKLRANPCYKEVNLIFFNSHAEKGSGYNLMPSMERKAEVFDSALEVMERKFSPDIILIACNTLSVVYPLTQFSKKTQTKVLGIIDFGTEIISAELARKPKAKALILGTKTTIGSNVHIDELVSKGVERERLYGKAMPDLESEIQYSPHSSKVKQMIRNYLGEAFKEIDYRGEFIFTALCCTHYGYSREVFEMSLSGLADGKYLILNPNDSMINSVVSDCGEKNYQASRIKVEVVSRAVLDEEERKSISDIIRENAPLTADALVNYINDKDLFYFRKET
ncbi:MAG: aspartate/glutamate racemase family protein [Ignavibacteriaceae bacterium]|nr:aspartate/glutamate racemase family protein [Ignavibacteriaceae bacterium]